MIPTIDILFQLVIFFMLACQFAVVEQFPVAVPDECKNSLPQQTGEHKAVMVTVMEGSGGEAAVAVDNEKIGGAGGETMADRLAAVVSEELKKLPEKERVVCLRIAKDIPFAQSQYALKGINESSATSVQLAVLKEREEK
jgi:biopolymer transport protein ExbD